MAITALLGGAASTGVLALTGAFGNDAQATTTAVVPASTSDTPDTSSASALLGFAPEHLIEITRGAL